MKDITNPEDKLELRGDENFPIYRRIYYKEGIQTKNLPSEKSSFENLSSNSPSFTLPKI